MSTDRDTTRIVRSWLEEGATALPDRVLDAVLDQLPATPQRRAWVPAWMFRAMSTPDASSTRHGINRTKRRQAVGVPWRNPSMPGLFKWAVAVVVIAVVGALAFVVLQPKAAPNVAAPSVAAPTLAAPSVVAPSVASPVAATAAPATAAPGSAAPASAALPTSIPIAVAAGHAFTCVVTGAAGVKCWGDNSAGQLGNGTKVASSSPVEVSGLAGGVVAIALGFQQSCALTDTGRVQCWGLNNFGQLGNGAAVGISSIPVDVSGLTSGVTAIAAGAFHFCALTSQGGVKCWGDNYGGQIGNGSDKTQTKPADVVGLTSGVVAIAAGAQHTCAVTKAGGVKCWGLNGNGELGNGSTTYSFSPVDVVGLTNGVTAVAAGQFYSCALLRGGGVKCWGHNDLGQLGNDGLTDSAVPVDVAGLASGVTAMTTNALAEPAGAGSNSTCALTTVGSVKCWGSNVSGQLGNGTRIDSKIAVDVSSLAGGVTAIAVGGLHGCAIAGGGVVACWGTNTYGGLGDGTTVDRLTPVVVKGL